MTKREEAIEAMGRAVALAEGEDYMEDHRRYDRSATAAFDAVIAVLMEVSIPMAMAGYCEYSKTYAETILGGVSDDSSGRQIASACFSGRVWKAMLAEAAK